MARNPKPKDVRITLLPATHAVLKRIAKGNQRTVGKEATLRVLASLEKEVVS